MQIQFHYFPKCFLVSVHFFLFATSLSVCANEVNRGVQSTDSQFLVNCPAVRSYEAKRRIAKTATKSIRQGKLSEAKAWLACVPPDENVWETLVVHGDIYAHDENWQLATNYYNKALDYMDDPRATPQEPTQTEIDEVDQLASFAQSVAGDLGTSRGSVRGIPRRRVLPILFDSGGTMLNGNGKKLVRRLANFIKQKKVTQLELHGHTDEVGKSWKNKRISKKRALSVKKELKDLGVTAKIRVIGKGEDEPLKIVNRWRLPKKRIRQLNRRVEAKVVRKARR
jgi:outer membrane protein OmpA-like peptidoglycan-associated protein